jgi:hypothetical protein
MKAQIGQTLKDVITGFTGIATGRCEYVTGCTQLLLQPPTKENGDFVESRWLDEDRLVLVSDANRGFLERFARSIGPDKEAPRR